MNYLPLPGDFPSQLSDTLSLEDAEEQFQRFVNLANHQLSFLETIQLDTAVQQVQERISEVPVPRARLALLGSSTVQQLLPAIRVSSLRNGILLDLYAGAYGQYKQEILEPSDSLRVFDPDFILFAVNGVEVLAGTAITDVPEQVDRAVSSFIDDMRAFWKTARHSFGATIVQQSILDVTNPLFGGYDRFVPGSPTRVIAVANELLAEAAQKEQVFWLDVNAQCARDGIDAWFDQSRWLQGKMEIAPHAAERYGNLVARLLVAQRGESRKCLVLDLDDTLWGGVLGDDGVDGIVLGQGSAVGEAYLSFQIYLKQLSERGIILSVCSKNDAAIATSAFESHPEMHLAMQDIAVFVANWENKASNIEYIAKQLNIGLDSMVFVDDNPAERALVRKFLPMVAVPELPEDPAGYARCLADCGFFEAVSVSDEDFQRKQQYAENAVRKDFQRNAHSIESYLSDLNMEMSYEEANSVNLSRVTQLINKTNQFNTTTQRLTANEISSIADHPGRLLFVFRLVDRFGDNGIVSVVSLSATASDSCALHIVNWVMSCRVFGRQLENEIMNVLVEEARKRDFDTLTAQFIPSQKNAVIESLYQNLGFTPQDTDGGEITGWWNLKVGNYKTFTTSIELTEQ